MKFFWYSDEKEQIFDKVYDLIALLSIPCEEHLHFFPSF